jgi:chromosome segregation ATPase
MFPFMPMCSRSEERRIRLDAMVAKIAPTYIAQNWTYKNIVEAASNLINEIDKQIEAEKKEREQRQKERELAKKAALENNEELKLMKAKAEELKAKSNSTNVECNKEYQLLTELQKKRPTTKRNLSAVKTAKAVYDELRVKHDKACSEYENERNNVFALERKIETQFEDEE